MTTREEYIEKLTEQLKKWDKELNELEEKADKKISYMKDTYRKKLRKAKAKRDQLRAKLDNTEDIEDISKETLEKAKHDFEHLLDDTKEGLEKIKNQLV